MPFTYYNIVFIAFFLSVCVGCNNVYTNSVSNSTTSIIVPSEFLTDKWIGKWNGAEGTYLQISGQHGKYKIIISNLDGPRNFQGTADKNSILFTRDGKLESIHASTGKKTGMKWLSEKINCLTIETGEGYCRD